MPLPKEVIERVRRLQESIAASLTARKPPGGAKIDMGGPFITANGMRIAAGAYGAAAFLQAFLAANEVSTREANSAEKMDSSGVQQQYGTSLRDAGVFNPPKGSRYKSERQLSQAERDAHESKFFFCDFANGFNREREKIATQYSGRNYVIPDAVVTDWTNAWGQKVTPATDIKAFVDAVNK
ncbi:hypothetical protein [Bradyrhizobium sp. AUGA SZCCT0182]|uniref:hypothetical protein n=1 Tax=Bradyrhizobium sp. AUGA SZCCT0182 TaxID=2807667 RepID=UPI001BA67AE7|nr:hypothetical protein [Bradyrhizobium sp. AUGA SZCCT0182]MBR1232050.1 hypothetical protein [Bradyrhizobium sp. AUGA SZCCT0182]